jgi:hypothetical protein
MLQIDLTATSTGTHYLEFGMNADELSDFQIQMWITKYGKRAVDWLQSLSLGFVSFMGGDLWVHNQPETIVARGNLFGEQKDCYIGIIANEQPNLVKILDSIGIHTDREWEVTSITIPHVLNHPDGMSSRIPKGKFKWREGILKAEFLRNMKTTSGVDSTLELLKGEYLRGYAAYIIMKNTSTNQMKLFKIDINYTGSKQ